MKLRAIGSLVLCLTAGWMVGCHAPGDVQAVAPAHQEDMVGTAPENGSYVLYRAVGFAQSSAPVIERVWTVPVSRGQKIGFQWKIDKAHEWDPAGGYHLHAFAGDNTRDLGPFLDRDVKYVWAGANSDVAGYFHHQAVQHNVQAATWQ